MKPNVVLFPGVKQQSHVTAAQVLDEIGHLHAQFAAEMREKRFETDPSYRAGYLERVARLLNAIAADARAAS